MGGTGLGFGSMGSFGSTLGYGSTGGGAPSANTTAAVTNPGSGKLEAYDPTTMTTQTKPMTMPGSPITGIGMASSGVPDYVSNFLQSGGTGTLPTSSMGSNFANTEKSAPGALLATDTSAQKAAIDAKKVAQTKEKAAADAAAANKKTTTAAAPAAATGLTMVPQQNNYQQPLYVNDQWNFQNGTSQPMATPALGQGGPNSGGGQMPIYQDGKGGFFYDVAGKQPVPPGAAQQFKMMLQTQGHL